MSDFETVKQRADIVEVVEGYVSLRRKGRLLEACCPFHNERTPSFTVDPARQSWHCWASVQHRWRRHLLRQAARRIFTGRVRSRTLAERYGVELSRRPRRDDELRHGAAGRSA
ncbi:MAG: CHC2 zinc finger domain-containing protein [Dehalococcoidia bacterium]